MPFRYKHSSCQIFLIPPPAELVHVVGDVCGCEWNAVPARMFASEYNFTYAYAYMYGGASAVGGGVFVCVLAGVNLAGSLPGAALTLFHIK